MVMINKLDFQICQIPEHMRIVYVYVRKDKTYFTFDYNYLKSILPECTDVTVKKLQATNHLKVNFRRKKIVDIKNKVFLLFEPIE
jgi:hypothetical protein